MARIAGFLVGSATAIVLMLLVIGTPELGVPEPLVAEPPAAAAPVPASPPVPDTAPEPAPAPEPEPVPARWHAFWSPFSSRIAADGFVRRLEAVTGFDYRVVKIDNGVYEVAFAYVDEEDRDAMLSTIAAATGLELPDS